ncbi:ATP-binding cassette domain-containing protein [Sinorhizobium medicae]|uniref:ATP-binding cassette domain-containing protein n=1 Tax=Sinorhizobium medicae TaxID=110321 RepID=UPI003C72CEB6
MASVTLRNVSKTFGTYDVIRSIDLEIEDGEFVVFVGPSGCGKSTLLRLIAGLVPVSGGDVFIGGDQVTDVPASKRGLAFVFQSYALYPHMNVARNIGFALETARLGKDEIRRRVARVAHAEDRPSARAAAAPAFRRPAAARRDRSSVGRPAGGFPLR